MEPKKEGQSQSEEDSILELFGEITDFQNESNYDESKVEKLRVQRGDFVEKCSKFRVFPEDELIDMFGWLIDKTAG